MKAKSKIMAASIKVLRTRSDFDDFFYPVHDWPTQKKELNAMMDALKQGRPIDDKMRDDIVKALWFLYVKQRAETLVRSRGRRQSPTVRFAALAAVLIDKHKARVKDAILTAIDDDNVDEKFIDSVATTCRAIRRGEIKALPMSERVIEAAAQRLHGTKNGNNST